MVVIGGSAFGRGLGMVVVGQGAADTSGTHSPYAISIGNNSNSGTDNIGQGSITIGRQMSASAQGAIMMGYTNAGEMINSRTDSFALGWDETIPSMWIEKYTTTTTGVAGTSTMNIPIDDLSAYTLKIMVTGGESDATPAFFASRTFEALYTRSGATATEQGENASTLIDIGGESCNITLAASGNNAQITVTGPSTTSTNMNWRAVVHLSKVTIG
jgi:hypothetical protein